VIAPDGRVTARAPQFEPAVLKSTVQPRTGLTPYARTGDGPILSVSFLLLVIFGIARLRARRSP
jgi:apolipoprotein N-acyltransferase